MTDLRNGGLEALVRPDRVHRRVYTDPDIFDLEMERIFGRVWVYVGHESQLKAAGDFFTTRLGRVPLIITRHSDGRIHGLRNQCAHRGSLVCVADAGRARTFVCPYHSWTYRGDGSLVSVPRKSGYGADFDLGDARFHLQTVGAIDSYRGFIFARLAASGPDLESYLGALRLALDNIVDRAPDGEIELAGGFFKQTFPGNWKLHPENANDLVHPIFVHESSATPAQQYAADRPGDEKLGQQAEMFRANGIPIEEMDAVGVWGYGALGHAYMGGFYKQGEIALRRKDEVFSRYEQALIARHGEARADEILSMNRFNNLIYPNMSVNTRFQQLRVIHPIAVDRTDVYSYCFRLKGAPEEMFHASIRFLTTANSPASLISADDIEIFDRCQRGMTGAGKDWIDFSRGLGTEIADADGGEHTPAGTAELPMRTQYRAWLRHMCGDAA